MTDFTFRQALSVVYRTQGIGTAIGFVIGNGLAYLIPAPVSRWMVTRWLREASNDS
jgi:hypothetical protein